MLSVVWRKDEEMSTPQDKDDTEFSSSKSGYLDRFVWEIPKSWFFIGMMQTEISE